MQFFDAHTHVHFPAYDADREDVFRRAKEANVKMITVGTQFSTSRGAVEYAKKHPGDVWATVGFHPTHFSKNWYHDKNEQKGSEREEFNTTELKKLTILPEVVAIGECGLDFFRDKSEETKNSQKEAFLKHIEIAHEVKKPLMIHCRAAFNDLIETLSSQFSLLSSRPGIIHFFSGTKDEAKKLLDMGFAFTFGGVVTFTHDYDDVIKMLPPEAILSETDAPYVAPVPYRGKRNEPAHVVEVVKKLAEIKGVNTEEMAAKIFENAKRVFALKV